MDRLFIELMAHVNQMSSQPMHLTDEFVLCLPKKFKVFFTEIMHWKVLSGAELRTCEPVAGLYLFLVQENLV